MKSQKVSSKCEHPSAEVTHRVVAVTPSADGGVLWHRFSVAEKIFHGLYLVQAAAQTRTLIKAHLFFLNPASVTVCVGN